MVPGIVHMDKKPKTHCSLLVTTHFREKAGVMHFLHCMKILFTNDLYIFAQLVCFTHYVCYLCHKTHISLLDSHAQVLHNTSSTGSVGVPWCPRVRVFESRVIQLPCCPPCFTSAASLTHTRPKPDTCKHAHSFRYRWTHTHECTRAHTNTGMPYSHCHSRKSRHPVPQQNVSQLLRQRITTFDYFFFFYASSFFLSFQPHLSWHVFMQWRSLFLDRSVWKSSYCEWR